MFQKRRFVVILALLSSVILTITGCSSSLADKAADNAKVFADQKNYAQAATTLHSVERELGSNFGPKELKALSNAYSYIAIKITDDARKLAKKGDYEEAFSALNGIYEVINLQGTIKLSSEASEGIQSAKEEIAKQCLNEALDSKLKPRDAVDLFNIASKGTKFPLEPETIKIFDNARIKLTETPAIIIIEICKSDNFQPAEQVMRFLDSIDTSISNEQSDKAVEARKVFQSRQTQVKIDEYFTQVEQYMSGSNGPRIYSMFEILRLIHDDPFYSESITEKQKKRYNTIVTWINKEVRKAEASGYYAYSGDSVGKDIFKTFPIQ